ncbi:unnamed protein product [Sphenostylis stenocarpa]|uniref:Prohibitin n=1 Tax=Sphenostylis stenocarpa TaxID=92480 RepID=A0AA86SS92_9FABA|nr:unnamed protein product [Sphenostylis stenocarpa]
MQAMEREPHLLEFSQYFPEIQMSIEMLAVAHLSNEFSSYSHELLSHSHLICCAVIKSPWMAIHILMGILVDYCGLNVYPEGTHFIILWFERPDINDVHAGPHLVDSTSRSHDLQMLNTFQTSALALGLKYWILMIKDLSHFHISLTTSEPDSLSLAFVLMADGICVDTLPIILCILSFLPLSWAILCAFSSSMNVRMLEV